MATLTDKLVALLRGYGDLTLGGWQDEIQGAIQAALPVPGDQGSFADRYRKQTDAARASIEQEKAKAPGYYTGGQGLGLGATLLLPAARASSTVGNAGRLLRLARAGVPAAVTAGTLGMVSGAGHSEADTAEGVLTDASKSAMWSAPLGFAGGAAGEQLAASAAAKEAAALQKATQEVDKAINVKRAALGGATQGGSRSGENLTRLGRRGGLTPQEAQDLAVLEQRVGDNTIKELGPQLQRISEAEQEFSSAVANRASDIADKVSKGRAVDALKERSKRYLLPMAIGAGTGYLFGGDWKTAGFGAGAGLGLRPTLRSFGRLAWTNPATVTNVTAPALRGAGTALTRSAPATGDLAGMMAATRAPAKLSVDPFFEQGAQDPFFEE